MITMNPRKFWSILIGSIALCLITGVLIAALTISVFMMQEREAQTATQIESAYAKGAMIKIAASKARCQQWKLRASEAVCE